MPGPTLLLRAAWIERRRVDARIPRWHCQVCALKLTSCGIFLFDLLNHLFFEMTLRALKEKRREPNEYGLASITVKLVASAGDTGQTGYSVKLSTRLTPGNDGLHRNTRRTSDFDFPMH